MRTIVSTLVFGVLLVLFTSASALTALAHGGDRVFAGTAGPYNVEAFVLRLQGGGDRPDALDYTLSLREEATGRPVDGATVSVSAETPGGTLGPFEAVGFANQYQAIIPVEHAGTWTMEVQFEGPPGTSTLVHEMTVAPPESTWRALLTSPLVLLAALVIVVAIGMTYVERTRESE